MSRVIIQAENISKLYHLGKIGTGSLRRDMQHWWKSRILGKEDPYFKNAQDERDSIWALKNVNFEIREGEAWGIIGRNGAGKSTFLKILSRIVKPTEGSVKGRGKISSLLEVGTGFHEDLTGRENIFISGNILGMNKREILQKFDEIVDFSGIEKFLDTPVKRYSSGMYVRLAFAVAAHLEPDILIVDEVLAVGDAEFQKKCLGKMKDDSSKTGRTVIFVSHNLQAISNLCTQAIWLEKGKVCARGDAKNVVNKYLGSESKKSWKQEFFNPDNAPGNDQIKVLLFELEPQLSSPLLPIDIRTPLTVRFKFLNLSDNIKLAVGIHLFTITGECIFDVSHTPAIYNYGILEGECHIPGQFLNDGSYYLSIIFVKDSSEVLYYYEESLNFDVEDFRENMNWYGKWIGCVRPQFPVTLRQSEIKIPQLND
jgi:lipopolysaccharide transport system ATP-binding protein